MAFKLKSGNKIDFKNMGSSPIRVENAFAAEEGNYNNSDKVFGNKEVDVIKDDEQGKNAGDISGVYDTKDKTSTETAANNESDSNEKEQLRAQSKKEMYANAFQNSGIGHITEAGKSIGRGIKNIRARRQAKKAEKLTSANEAIENDTQTFKQQKLADKANRKSNRQEDREWKKEDRSDKKLAKYNVKKDKKAVKETKRVAKMQAKIDKERNS
tara:strand:+ start:211 stop:849 length:639 start_codon:yes stop_codon:yes gene_type:complete